MNPKNGKKAMCLSCVRNKLFVINVIHWIYVCYAGNAFCVYPLERYFVCGWFFPLTLSVIWLTPYWLGGGGRPDLS